MPTPPLFKRIFQYPSLVTPASQLSGAYMEWEVPLGPVAGAYKNCRGTPEDFVAYLQAQGLLGAASVIAQALSLSGAQQLRLNNPPDPQVVSNVLYAIEDSRWNSGKGGTVYVHGLSTDEYAPVGYALVKGVRMLVSVDVVAGTFSEFQSGSSLTTIDLLDLTGAQMDQVMALAYTDCDADPATSPAWSYPGMEFDAIDPNTSGNYHYYCSRSTYVPGNTTTGVGPCWHRVEKL
jgi:hypothetical protein